jgi:hypothetical protein
LILSAKALVAIGEMLLMSTTTLRAPGWPSRAAMPRPAATPASANRTASTSGVSGTMRNTMSARSATPRAVVHWVALLPATAGGILPRVWTNS